MGVITLILQPLAILTCAIVGYILFFQETTARINDHYSMPNWNLFIKKRWASRKIRKLKQLQASELNDEYKNYTIEEPEMLYTENSTDSQMIYGSDQNGNSLLVKLTRCRHRNADVWLMLRLQNGQIYTLPEHPDIHLSNVNSKIFQARGLELTCLIPFSKWRLSFNGMLRKNIRNQYTIDYQENELEYLKFNFIWTTTSDPIHWPNDWNSELMATAVATEPWKSGKWLKVLAETKDGYDQFGSLYGQVFVQNKENNRKANGDIDMDIIELNLPGLRQRRRCITSKDTLSNYHRYATIIGVCTDGSIYNIGAYSLKHNLTHAQFGTVRKSNGDVYPIEWTDFHLSNIAEDSSNIPKAMTIRFSANKRIYSTTIYLLKQHQLPLFEGRPVTSKINIIPLELGLDGNRGYGISILWYPYKRNNADVVPIQDIRMNRIHLNDTPPNIEHLYYSLNDFEAHSVLTCGGKGSSLAILNSSMQIFRNSLETSGNRINVIKMHNFLVPDAFCLSVSAFNLQLQKSENLQIAIKNIESMIYGADDSVTDATLKLLCEKAITEFQLCTIDENIQSTIKDIFDTLEDQYKRNKLTNTLRLAVRSSAVCEDGTETSSAGQNATYLGLKNLQDVMDAVKKCWASLYSYHSVQYRKQHIQPINTQMAVVIQLMIPSECAGVLFTNHPDGNPTKVLITANYGLGESVVSGSVDPDVYVVRRDIKDQNLKITFKQSGTKSHRIEMSNDNNTEENVTTEELSIELQNQNCLNDLQIIKLAEIGVALEKLYGSARDIEWAIYKDNIYLLQARPITTQNTLSDWELLHEFDSAIMSSDELLTTANLGEVFPNTVSPLTNTIINHIDKSVSENVLHRTPSRLYNRSILHSHHRIFMDVYLVFLQIVEKEIGFSSKVQNIAVFGHEYLTENINKTATQRNGIASSYKKMKALLEMLKQMLYNKSNLEELKRLVKSFRNQYSDNNVTAFKTSRELFNDINNLLTHMKQVLNVHSKVSSVCVTLQIIILSILGEGSTEPTNEHYSDMALMLGSCKEVESAEIPMLLQQIINKIDVSGKSNEFEKIKSVDGVKWLELHCSEAYILFKEFIQKNCHRCLQEFDLMSETWGMRPDIVIDMLQVTIRTNRNVKVNNNLNMQNRNYTNEQIIEKLKTPKKRSTRKIISKLLPMCKKSVQFRETSKSNLIEFIHELRKGYIYLSELMYREGYLPNKKLIFFLTELEIENILECKNIGLITKAMRRQKLYSKWYQYRFKEMNFGVIEPINSDISELQKQLLINDNKSSTAVVVMGTPVSGGTIIGRACVLKHFSEVSKIEAGDILITHSTDIGWSPYFPMLGGVVTELGGLISHGAVVAREYGLPCIVGAVGATDKLKFGDKIILDADKGIITKIEIENKSDDMLF